MLKRHLQLTFWFLKVYKELAEPLAVQGLEDPTLDDLEYLPVEVGHPLAAVAINLGAPGEERMAGRRYLNPGAAFLSRPAVR